jgi:tRNA-uridine 2-sulfurtransferase
MSATTPSSGRKCVALISGGLDSMLAARVMLDQGIHVEGINFYTGFCIEGHTQSIRRQPPDRVKRNNALWVAEQLDIKLHIIDVIDEYKDVVINPKHGYGANLNPCLDCKGFMVRKAREWMEARGFDFIVTGEVLGQRPMSQRRDTMPVVARESGAYDRLVRPLCAKLMPPTLPEREGWIDREQLLSFNGRARKAQMELAQQYGIEEYAQPAGGCCFLTNKEYAHKLTDLWHHRGEKNYDLEDVILLKVGRHLRPRPNFKLVVARDEGESNFLQGLRHRYFHMIATSHPGPLALIDGDPADNDLELAAQLTARYGKGREADTVTVAVTDRTGQTRMFNVRPLPADQIPAAWHI